MYSLRPYQKKAVENIASRLRAGVKRQVLVLATWLWKTFVFCQFPEHVKKRGKKTLILAHRWELLEQAKDELLNISPHLNVQIEKWEETSDPNADVIIASVQTLGREGSNRIEKFSPDEFGMIIIDEAHHSTASTYQNILTYFWANPNTELRPDHPLVLGVTATPNRRDNVWLDTIFEEVIFKYDIKDGIQDGYLAPIKAYSIFTDESLEWVTVRAGDFANNELSKAVNTARRNKLIVETYKKISDGEKAVAFCVDVAHSEELANMFRDEWYRAVSISGETPAEERRELLDKFKNWNIQIVCNCMILTEGYNNPAIKTVLFARPTTSNSLYLQMGGRWTRLHPGKDFVNFVDFVDNLSKHRLVTSSTIIGLDQPIKVKWEPLLELEDKFAEIISASPYEDLSELEIEDLDKRIQEVDIFKHAKLSEFIKTNSGYAWNKYYEGYRLSLGRHEGEPLLCEVRENAIGKYTVRFLLLEEQTPMFSNGFKKYSEKELHEFQADDLVWAIQEADKYIFDNYRENVSLVRQDAKRRWEPPSEKQIKILKKFGYHNAHELSKGEASTLLGKIFADREKKRKK